jgi:hypothetical protein
VAERPSRSAIAALSRRDFRRFWIAALVSNTGRWMQNAAIPRVAFTITGSAGDVGVTGVLPVPALHGHGTPRRRAGGPLSQVVLLLTRQLAQALCALVATGRFVVLGAADDARDAAARATG